MDILGTVLAGLFTASIVAFVAAHWLGTDDGDIAG